MLAGGEDPIFIMRRLIILASEDVGNASVQALPLAVNALVALEKSVCRRKNFTQPSDSFSG